MSRQQSVLRDTVGYMLKNIDNKATNGEEKSKPEVIKLGLDLHASRSRSVVNWTVQHPSLHSRGIQGSYWIEWKSG
jgi:hypothetical protein